ncbi:MAG: antitoxin VbhA family protein [Treponema sp.]|jgi:putative transcriptional regulator|nr:antitoxin VbhA family protein [Treponema sp.]
MAYKPLEIDRQNLTIMGVRFSDIDTLNSAANAIGSNMFEGFEPTPRLVEIYRDYREGKIPSGGFIETLRGAV